MATSKSRSLLVDAHAKARIPKEFKKIIAGHGRRIHPIFPLGIPVFDARLLLDDATAEQIRKVLTSKDYGKRFELGIVAIQSPYDAIPARTRATGRTAGPR